MGEAKKHQHIAAAEILVGDRLSRLIGQGERTADQRLAAWSRRSDRTAMVRQKRASADQRPDQEAGNDHGEETVLASIRQVAAATR